MHVVQKYVQKWMILLNSLMVHSSWLFKGYHVLKELRNYMHL